MVVTEPRFPIGLTFKVKIQGTKIVREHMIVDIYKTYNYVNKLVKVRYVTRHTFAGQPVTDYDVVDTTIAKALWDEFGKLPTTATATTDDWGNP